MLNKATACVALLLALMASSCSKKVGGQVVAIVNGQEITQQELNAELAAVQVPAGAERTAVMAELLQRVIDRTLLAAKAREEGIDQTPTYLGQVQRMKDAILGDLLAKKIGNGIALPTASDADAFMAQNATLFSARQRYQLDQIVYPQSKDPSLALKLKGAKSMSDVAAVLTTAGIRFQTGKTVIDTGELQPQRAKQMAALAAGEPFLIPQGGLIIASAITSREPVTISSDQSRPTATQMLRQQALSNAVAAEVKSERDAAEIEYGAGFAPKNVPTPPRN